MDSSKSRGGPTLADIALEAGVSVSAVSLALSDKGKISEPIRARIKQIAAELDYKPRSAPAEGGGMVGLLVEELPESSFSDYLFSHLIMGAEKVLAGAGLRPTLSVIRDEGDKEAMLAKGHSQFAGLLVLGGGDLGDSFLRELTALPTPVVLADTYLSNAQAFSVTADNLRGAQAAVEHLISLGHRRIGMLRGSSKYKPLHDRWTGFVCAMAGAGLAIESALVPPRVSHGPDKGYAEMNLLLDLPQPERPTAVFACSDRTALRAMDAIRERGLRVPDDIAVVGFDDFPQASYNNPPLTSVRLPMSEIGRLAALRLVRVLDGKEPYPYASVLPTELVIRESSGNRLREAVINGCT